MSLRIVKVSSSLRALSALSTRAMSSGGYGTGSGKGGGDGGSIRKAGGAFGEMEAAREEEYFRRLQAKQLKDLNKSMKDTMSFHEEQIRDYEKAIEHHKKMIRNLEEMKEKHDN